MMMRKTMPSCALRWRLSRARRPTAIVASSRASLPSTYLNWHDHVATKLSRRGFSSLATRAWEMIRMGSLNPHNPLLPENYDLPDFASVQPHHLVTAAEKIHKRYTSDLRDLEETLLNGSSPASSEWLLGELTKLNEHFDYMNNVAALYEHLFQIPEWENASNKVASILYRKPHEWSHIIMNALERLDTEESSDASAIRHFLKLYQNRGVQHADESTVQSLQDGWDEIEARFLQRMKMSAFRNVTTREQLEDMYAMIGSKAQFAKLLGYGNYAEFVLASERRMAISPAEIELLHKQVNERFDSELMIGEEYEDTRRLLTLDGVLIGMFGLARAMFGIVINEDESACGWTSDVRLFHAVNEGTQEPLGSIYLDPFFRGAKARHSFLSPLTSRSVFMSAPISAPAWSDMPAPLKFDEVLSLFHEFGHALQFILADQQSSVPPDHMPQDVSELMPQFMEHFLFEEQILQTLAHLSGSADPFPTEMVEKLRKQRMSEKQQTMSHRVFLGQLELELFSNPDESLVTLQRRIAEEYIPQRLPDKSDLNPLLEVMTDNANGKHMCRYRYLWGEVMSTDIYELFREAGVGNQEKTRELGMRLRKELIEPGGLMDARASFRRFRGRDISPDAMFASYNP